MPNQSFPARRFKTMIERISEKKKGQGGAVQKVTIGRVEQVLPNNKVTVDGAILPVTGTAAGIAEGQRVGLAWADGKPTAVIFHHAQSAQFIPTLAGGGGIIEELLIADNNGLLDVWFRNATQLTPLGLRRPNSQGVTHLTSDPTEVFWGVNESTFCVKTGEDTSTTFAAYHVFKLKRKADDKILTSAATVSSKLYSVNLGDLEPILLQDLQLVLHRDSAEPVIETDWHPNPTPGEQFNFDGAVLRRDTNINKADVTRTYHLKLHGASQLEMVEDVTGSFIEGQPTILTRVRAIVDDNDDLVYGVTILLQTFAIKQGNSIVGLTGSYFRLGCGDICNAGIIFVADAPWNVDDVGIQGFNGNGNVGGVLATNIDEEHSVVVKYSHVAATAAIEWSTFATSKTLNTEEDQSGVTPYFATDLSSMPGPACNHQNPATDGNNLEPTASGPITDMNFGDVGALGVIKQERSLFNPALPLGAFDADRTALIQEGFEFSRWEREPQDTFTGVTFPPTGPSCNFYGAAFANSNSTLRARFTQTIGDVQERYRVFVRAVPFFAQGGQVWKFVTVLRQPQTVLNVAMVPQFPGDPIQVAAFVVKGASGAITVLDYFTVASADRAPVLMASCSSRLLWKLGTDVVMTDLDHGISAIVGTQSDDPKMLALILTEPDFLYNTTEQNGRYFVHGWNRQTFQITLAQAASDFPPREGALSQLGGLKNLSAVSPTTKGSYQTIFDTQLIPASLKNL